MKPLGTAWPVEDSPARQRRGSTHITADPACVLARSSSEFLQLPLTFLAHSPSVLYFKLSTTWKSSLRAFGTARMRVSGFQEPFVRFLDKQLVLAMSVAGRSLRSCRQLP